MMGEKVAKLHYKLQSALIFKTIGFLHPILYCLFHSRKIVAFTNFNNAADFVLHH